MTSSAGDATSVPDADGDERRAAGVETPATSPEQVAWLRHVKAIWHINGTVPMPAGLTSDTAFARLDPLFQTDGTRHERSGDTLSFTKKDPAAQDKMAVFDCGTLIVEPGADGPALRYHLISRSLLFCFLLPLLFLGFAQLAITFGKPEKPEAEAAATTGKTAAKPGDKAADKQAGKATDKVTTAKQPDKKDKVLPLNPIDKFLGAPAPEKDKDKKKKKDEKPEKKPSPTPAYVFAGLFAALYVIGRWLEDWLIRKRFRTLLQGD